MIKAPYRLSGLTLEHGKLFQAAPVSLAGIQQCVALLQIAFCTGLKAQIERSPDFWA